MKCMVLVFLAITALSCTSANLFKPPSYLDLVLGRYEPTPPPKKSTKRVVTEGSIEQHFDHFDLSNTATFTQRFFTSYEHYNVDEDGPLFILVGGEFPATESWLEGGMMYELAEEYGGAMFFLEHRFYGASIPADRDATVDTLQYLNTDQALYDLAYFIEQIRFIVPQFDDDPIVLVGGGLGGSLLTWFQRDYNLWINGAWASSAPLQSDSDFAEATELNGAVLRHVGGEACYNRVENAFAALEELFANEEYETIRSTMNVCPQVNIESENGQWILFDILASEFGAIMRFGGQRGLVDAACSVILNAESDVEALGDFQSLLFGDSCLNFDFETTVAMLSNEDWDNNNIGGRLGLFERCNEFGWFPTSTSEHQPFGSSFPVELFHRLCHDVFGPEYTAENIVNSLEDFNERYGGLNPVVYNMFLTQGMYDWLRPAGPQEDLSDTAETHLIEESGFMMDMYGFALIDNPEDLYATQDLLRERVGEWVGTTKRSVK